MLSRSLMYFVGVSLALLSPCVTCAETAGWPQFRGPNALGVAADGNYPIEFDGESNVQWKVALPPGVSSPCIVGDRVFVTAHDTEHNRLETICVDRSSGQIVWRKSAESQKIENVHEVSSPANATPRFGWRAGLRLL